MIHNIVKQYQGISIFCGIGERCREALDLYQEMRGAGVLQNTVMIFGQMDEPPGVRFRVGHAALTMSEYFRDTAKQDVLLLINNIFTPCATIFSVLIYKVFRNQQTEP